MKKPIYGWHFVGDTLRDGSPIPPYGEWLEYKGEVKMCESGLHYSLEPFDALQYAPGSTLCYVEIEDVIDTKKDKGVCRRRKIIAKGDATEALRFFARMQAVSVIENYPNGTDDVVFDWLMGDDSARSAAYSASRSAARSAAWSAADSAAYSAAWSAADSAAYSASRSAARSAAWSAADSAAYSAAWSAARQYFNDLIYECFEDVML